MIRFGRGAEFVDDRLHDGVRRHGSRQRPHDPAETLGLGVAALHVDARRPGIHDGRGRQAEHRDRHGQVRPAAAREGELDQTLADQDRGGDPEQRPGNEDARNPAAWVKYLQRRIPKFQRLLRRLSG